MIDAPISVEILSPRQAAAGRTERQPFMAQKFDERLASPFILKSLSAETRESYRRGIHEFFLHIGWLHPCTSSHRLLKLDFSQEGKYDS